MHERSDGTLIGGRIKEAREYLDLSLDELAQVVGIDLHRLMAIENGQDIPEATLLPMFSRALGRGVSYFLGNVDAASASERTEFLARAAEGLSEDDMGELRRFATYLKTRSEDAHA